MASNEDHTRCQLPPPLDDLDLIAALDDEADESVLYHLRSCRACARRARDFAALQQILRRRLFRALCPASDDLAAFQQRVLNPERYVAIADHLIDCPHCARERRLLMRAATLPSPQAMAAMLPQRRINLRILAPSPLALAGVDLYGRIRGPAGAQYVYRAENIQLMLSVERAVGRLGRVLLSGFLALDDLVGGHAGATASLLADGEVIGSALIDELGCFIIEDILPGDYTLSLRLRDRELAVEALQI
jgi:hypothetical protein